MWSCLDQRKSNEQSRRVTEIMSPPCKGEKLVPFKQFQCLRRFPSWAWNSLSLWLLMWYDRRRSAGPPLHSEVPTVASWTALYAHAKCVLIHFSDAAEVRGANPAVTGKAHGPTKRIWSLEKTIKAESPLSKCVQLKKCSVCDHFKG